MIMVKHVDSIVGSLLPIRLSTFKVVYVYNYIICIYYMSICVYICMYIYVTRRGERVLRAGFGDK